LKAQYAFSFSLHLSNPFGTSSGPFNFFLMMRFSLSKSIPIERAPERARVFGFGLHTMKA
jgi:hypothetical protein